jgi:hypothetical protein
MGDSKVNMKPGNVSKIILLRDKMKILDATAGCRSIWYQKNHPFVTFMDKRNGTFIARSENSKLKDNRYKKINPDVIKKC